MSGVFVTGTDTEIGKTWVSTGLLVALQRAGIAAVGMKPVAAGAERHASGLRNADALALIAAGCGVPAYGDVNPYCFAPPIAPHIAAEEAGVTVAPARVAAARRRLLRGADYTVVEGVGGWRVPLGPRLDVAALAGTLGLPVVLVVGLRLGCLNHALLSADAIARSGCRLAGWVANTVDPAMARKGANLQELERRLAAPCLGRVPHLSGALAPARVADALDVTPLRS